MLKRAFVIVACLLCLLVAGCSRDVWVAELVEATAAPDGSGIPAVDPGESLRDGGPLAQPLCFDPNAPLLPGDASGPVCAASLARQRFRYALCVCETAIMPHMSTDAFDSRSPTAGFEDWGASVGINGGLPAGLFTGHIGGSLVARNASPLQATSSLNVTGDLMLQGTLTLASQLRVGRDAWLRGWVTGAGSLTVQRDLHIWSEGLNLSALPWLPSQTVGGASFEHDFTIPQPCGCSGSEQLDIQGLVARASRLARPESDSGNGETWTGLTGSHVLTLPCGAYHLDAVSIAGDLTVEVEGRSALFIAGDLQVGGSLSIHLQPGGELDLWVAGDLTMARFGTFGDPARPRALRVYTASDRPLRTSDPLVFAAALYAPNADLRIASSDPIFGALFVGRLIAEGPVQLHYDLGISVDTPTCGDAETCGGCEDCAGLACEAGRCRACEADADCCQPWTCHTGRCVPIGTDP